MLARGDSLKAVALVANHAVEGGSDIRAESAGLVRISLTCRGRASRLLLELAKFNHSGVDALGTTGCDAVGVWGI